jgi:hypothetical protein
MTSGQDLLQIPGIVNGKSIELEQETGLPEGSQVMINILPVSLPLNEKLKLAESLCGTWAGDPSLDAIFAEIEQQRDAAITRKIVNAQT